MKRLSSTLWLLSALVILCGCGTGGGRTSATTQQNPPPQGGNNAESEVAGNWQFNLSSKASGTPSLKIAGSINRSGDSVTGAVHVDGSKCFDQLTTAGLTGTVTDSTVSLTSESISGQVVTLNGTVANDSLTGTYTIDGGCAAGDKGTVTGINIPYYIGNNLGGKFSPSQGQTFDVSGDLTQSSSAGSEGSYGLTGTVTFNGSSCLNSGTITSGTFPSGSYIMGTSLALEIKTDNGALAFVGTLNPDKSEITGSYTVSGGTCDDTGTAVLTISSPWDY
jgi:hypothetical protein